MPTQSVSHPPNPLVLGRPLASGRWSLQDAPLHTPSSPALAHDYDYDWAARTLSPSLPLSAPCVLSAGSHCTAASIYPLLLSSPPTHLAPFHSSSSISCPTDISHLCRSGCLFIFCIFLYIFLSFDPAAFTASPSLSAEPLRIRTLPPRSISTCSPSQPPELARTAILYHLSSCLLRPHEFGDFPFFDSLEFPLAVTSPDEVDSFVPVLHLSRPRCSSQGKCRPPSSPSLPKNTAARPFKQTDGKPKSTPLRWRLTTSTVDSRSASHSCHATSQGQDIKNPLSLPWRRAMASDGIQTYNIPASPQDCQAMLNPRLQSLPPKQTLHPLSEWSRPTPLATAVSL